MTRGRAPSPTPMLQHGLLLAAVVITLLPYAWMVSSSLKANADIVSDAIELIPRHPILDNYIAAIAGTPVLTAILNSVIMAGGETILVVATSVFTAYPFARLRFRGRDTVFLLVLGSMMIPSQVTMIPTFILMKWLGWIDTYHGLIVPRAVTPFGIFLMRQFIAGVPDELIDAARVDGASELLILFRIVAPSVAPAIAALTLFAFVYHWNSYLWPLTVLQGNSRSYPIVISLSRLLSYNRGAMNTNLVMAGATLAVLPPLVLFVLLQRFFVDSIVGSGVKG